MSLSHIEQQSNLLREHGLKATPQRVGVLSVLSRAKKPLSISELQERTEGLDTVTVYRSIESFIKSSLARPVDLRHGHTDYELIRENEHHHHVVCESCGKIEDVDCPDLIPTDEILKRAPGFARLTDHALEFFGVCLNCA